VESLPAPPGTGPGASALPAPSEAVGAYLRLDVAAGDRAEVVGHRRNFLPAEWAGSHLAVGQVDAIGSPQADRVAPARTGGP
jgi:hypothetical protein